MGSGRVDSVLFADDFRCAVPVEVCGAWREVLHVVGWGGSFGGRFFGFRAVRGVFGLLFLHVGYCGGGWRNVVQVAGIAGQEREDLGVELGGAFYHGQVAAFVYQGDLGPVNASGPHAYRLRVDDLVLLPGDDEERYLDDPGLPGEPAAGDLAPPDAEGLGDGGWRGPAGVVHHLLGQVVGVCDEGTHPQPADRPRRAPQSVEQGTYEGQRGQPEHGRHVDLVLVGRRGDDDEASDDIGVICGQFYGHGPTEVVADNVGAGETEVGAEGVEEPAPIPHSVPRDGLVRLTEPTKVQGINRKPLRQTTRELLPEARRGEPTVHQNH